MTAEAKKKGYIEGIGRRKTAIARVRVSFGATKPSFTVNERSLEEYFPTASLQTIAQEALTLTDNRKHAAVTVKVSGSGPRAQAEAVRLGCARAIVANDRELRPVLKQAGFLMRDPRKVERKKFGLKKARRSPQWSKR